MKGEIRTSKGKVEVEGDPEFFTWLSAAAANARDGFVGQSAEMVGGTLELVPERPERQQPKGRLAHLTTTAKE